MEGLSIKSGGLYSALSQRLFYRLLTFPWLICVIAYVVADAATDGAPYYGQSTHLSSLIERGTILYLHLAQGCYPHQLKGR